MEEVSNLYIISDFTYTAKHENLVGLEFRYPLRSIIRTAYSVVRSHIKYEDTNKTLM